MNDEQAKALREPFKPAEIGKLPRVYCKACSESRAKHCDQHKIEKCGVCKARITEAHLHLDYVGHAATTDRLLKVDPEWSWAPVAHDQNGLPAFDPKGGLWITLTVCGVTRLGYGDQGKAGVKEAIGDAIRNAAMRFGVALDLWAKEDLQAEPASESPRSATGTAHPGPQQPRPKAPATPSGDGTIWLPPKGANTTPVDDDQRRHMFGIAEKHGIDKEGVRRILKAGTGSSSTAGLPQWQYDRLMQAIDAVKVPA